MHTKLDKIKIIIKKGAEDCLKSNYNEDLYCYSDQTIRKKTVCLSINIFVTKIYLMNKNKKRKFLKPDLIKSKNLHIFQL